jgi:hypothetical protein
MTRIPATAALALSASLALAAPASAWMLNAVVHDKDGKPSIVDYGYGNDRRACLIAMDAIKKMQPDAVFPQPCTPE